MLRKYSQSIMCHRWGWPWILARQRKVILFPWCLLKPYKPPNSVPLDSSKFHTYLIHPWSTYRYRYVETQRLTPWKGKSALVECNIIDFSLCCVYLVSKYDLWPRKFWNACTETNSDSKSAAPFSLLIFWHFLTVQAIITKHPRWEYQQIPKMFRQ